jgi:hypothetical protein
LLASATYFTPNVCSNDNYANVGNIATAQTAMLSGKYNFLWIFVQPPKFAIILTPTSQALVMYVLYHQR